MLFNIVKKKGLIAMGKKSLSLNQLMSDYFPNPSYDRGDKIIITEMSEKDYKKREIQRLQEELEELEELSDRLKKRVIAEIELIEELEEIEKEK